MEKIQIEYPKDSRARQEEWEAINRELSKLNHNLSKINSGGTVTTNNPTTTNSMEKRWERPKHGLWYHGLSMGTAGLLGGFMGFNDPRMAATRNAPPPYGPGVAFGLGAGKGMLEYAEVPPIRWTPRKA